MNEEFEAVNIISITDIIKSILFLQNNRRNKTIKYHGSSHSILFSINDKKYSMNLDYRHLNLDYIEDYMLNEEEINKSNLEYNFKDYAKILQNYGKDFLILLFITTVHKVLNEKIEFEFFGVLKSRLEMTEDILSDIMEKISSGLGFKVSDPMVYDIKTSMGYIEPEYNNLNKEPNYNKMYPEFSKKRTQSLMTASLFYIILGFLLRISDNGAEIQKIITKAPLKNDKDYKDIITFIVGKIKGNNVNVSFLNISFLWTLYYHLSKFYKTLSGFSNFGELENRIYKLGSSMSKDIIEGPLEKVFMEFIFQYLDPTFNDGMSNSYKLPKIIHAQNINNIINLDIDSTNIENPYRKIVKNITQLSIDIDMDIEKSITILSSYMSPIEFDNLIRLSMYYYINSKKEPELYSKFLYLDSYITGFYYNWFKEGAKVSVFDRPANKDRSYGDSIGKTAFYIQQLALFYIHGFIDIENKNKEDFYNFFYSLFINITLDNEYINKNRAYILNYIKISNTINEPLGVYIYNKIIDKKLPFITALVIDQHLEKGNPVTSFLIEKKKLSESMIKMLAKNKESAVEKISKIEDASRMDIYYIFMHLIAKSKGLFPNPFDKIKKSDFNLTMKQDLTIGSAFFNSSEV